MKKSLSLILLSFVLLQSCSPDETELSIPKPITKADIDIQNVVDKMQYGEAFDIKALLLKPGDDDPNTNLTTLFYANSKGNIQPIIENFEVKDVRVTTNGIFVLTNYGSTPFFVKYDHSWVELIDIGVGTHDINADGAIKNVFVGEDDNENIVFRNGTVLNTQTLQLNRSRSSSIGTIESISGNLWFRIEYYRSGGIIDLDVFNYYSPNAGYTTNFWGDQGNRFNGRFNIASFKGTNFALIPNWDNLGSNKTMLIDMETGNKTYSDSTVSYRNDMLRLDDGSVVGLHNTDSLSTSFKLIKLSAKKNNQGKLMPDRVLRSSTEVTPSLNGYTNKNTYLFGSDKYYIVKEADQVQVFDTSLMHKGDVLKGLSDMTLSLVDNLVYYSGIGLDNKPVSGVYNLDTNQNTVLDTNNNFINIQPL